MDVKEFQNQINEPRVVFAIQEAERQTSGEIRLFVSSKKITDPQKEAERIFLLEKMDQTRERNGVLLYIAPRSQTYAVIGDRGITEKVGDHFWKKIVESMGRHFKGTCFTTGIVEAIQEIGTALATHFPSQKDDQDELSNQIIRE